MCLRMCHSIVGEELFDLQEEDRVWYGWDMMTKAAGILNLPSPFHIVAYSQATSRIQHPLHPVQIDPERSDTTFCYVVQELQAPTAATFNNDLLAAISQKGVDKVAQLLGRGLDLRGPDTDVLPISTLLASAILVDHSVGLYSTLSTDGTTSAQGTVLTCFTLLGISRRSICIGAYYACTAS